MSNIILVHNGDVREFPTYRNLLDWVIGKLTAPPIVEQKAEVSAKDTRVNKTLDTILSDTPKAEVPKPTVINSNKGTDKPVNSFDIPPMRKPFFGGKDKGEMLSFLYSINGEFPRSRPADCARQLFMHTEAYRNMPAKEQDKIVNWGLSFLKKQVRETGKPATCETKMLTAWSLDKFSFLAGAKVTFKVSINPKG